MISCLVYKVRPNLNELKLSHIKLNELTAKSINTAGGKKND